MLHDLKYGLRMLLKRPGVTLIAVLSLALGIGANTAIFSLMDAVMLKSLPVREPDRLVLFGNGVSSGITLSFPNESWELFSYPFYRQARQRSQVFEDVTALSSMPSPIHGIVNGAGDIEKLDVRLVAGNYFSVLGVNAVAGRTLNDADDQAPGNHPVAVVSYAWWIKRLGGRTDAIGQTIKIDEVVYTIVGVAPKDFFGTTVGQAPDVWIPLAMEKKLPPMHWDSRENVRFQSLYVIGRLKIGVTTEQAVADVNLLFKQALQERAGSQPSEENLKNIERASIELTSVGHGLSDLRRQFSLSLKILMAVVTLVLLIACANVANILFAQGTARAKEFAVRLAVGAPRARLIRQLLVESLLIAGIGGLAGALIAFWGSRLLLLMASDGPEAIPVNVNPDERVFGFTLTVSVISAVVFGLVPALRATRIDPNSALKSGRTGARNAFQSPLGKLLVIGQVALSLLLLVGAGLFVRTLINLQSLPSGFVKENVVRFDIDTTVAGYKTDDPKFLSMLGDVEENVRHVPGVNGAAFSFFVFNQGHWQGPVEVSDDLPIEQRMVRTNVVGRDFFRVMGIPLVHGRLFNEADTADSPQVAVITESMAQRVFPNKSPLGQRFKFTEEGQFEVIGVVKDAKYGSLQEEIRPMAYYLHSQFPMPLSNFVVKTTGDPDTVIGSVRQAIKQINRNLPIDDVVTLSDHIDRSLVQQKLIARLAAFFGVLALLLACIGLYGLMSYGVARRTNEIGIRMALGAAKANVLWLILREALLLVVIGLMIGLGVSLFTSKTAASLLYGLKPNDPLTIALASLLLLIVALVAGYITARRASRVDPMTALREE